MVAVSPNRVLTITLNSQIIREMNYFSDGAKMHVNNLEFFKLLGYGLGAHIKAMPGHNSWY